MDEDDGGGPTRFVSDEAAFALLGAGADAHTIDPGTASGARPGGVPGRDLMATAGALAVWGTHASVGAGLVARSCMRATHS